MLLTVHTLEATVKWQDSPVILSVLMVKLELPVMDGLVKKPSLIFCIPRLATKASVH